MGIYRVKDPEIAPLPHFFFILKMLVDLTKKELKALCEFISYNNDIDKELDAIYDKLGGISNACTCKEDSNA